ncbi:unnamed protein product [Agarophyton chilense]|eukprot:gb/GEZJ01003616.1/.p1 GENE.gb/GEZJ01003616.1/~~gb/GEZJ01003616.1/.p1  ORF type:complete len:315 (-),score=39.80 gb/GEZJ01003616.1/:312-1256(-)
MLPLNSLKQTAHLRRAAATITTHNHSLVAPTTTTTAHHDTQSTILYSHRKHPSVYSDSSSTQAASAQSIIHSSSSFDDRLSSSLSPVHSKKSRLTNCELLISVLECYMTLQIRHNQSLETNQSSSLVKQHHVRQEHCLALKTNQEPSVFHALQPPSITPVEYLRRLARYAFCSRSAFILAFYYLDKIANLPQASLKVNSLSIHRLLLTATLLATKMVDDILYDNAHFAKVGGLDMQELNTLELDMLNVLHFELCVSAEQFEAFERSVLNDVLSCEDSQFAVLHERLRNMGYAPDEHLPPCSPVSSLDDFTSSDV